MSVAQYCRRRLYSLLITTCGVFLLMALGCDLVTADRGINVGIEDLGGPYKVDLAFTDDDGDASTPTVLNDIPALTFTLASNYKVADNPGFTNLLSGSSTSFSDYYITGYTITYTLIDAESSNPGTITDNVGGLAIHIQNGETFSAAASDIQVVTSATRERLITAFGTTGAFDILATITFKGYTEDRRGFTISGAFDIKFDEYAPS